MNRKEFLHNIKASLDKNPVCVEVGVLDGDFSVKILDALNPQKLYLIDPWEVGGDKNDVPYYKNLNEQPTAYSNLTNFEKVKERFSNEISNGQVILKKGFSYDVVDFFPDNFFDFIYIDACHLYGCVKADLEIFLPKLKSNGLMCGHDYNNKIINFEGVNKAVDEFINNYNFKIIIQSEESDWGSKKL